MLTKIDTKFAPIVLFVFARPDHTRRTLNALAANKLANESDLIIYADAARRPEEIDRVNEVRAFINSVTGFRTVTVIERDRNYGLARNIIEGVTAACERYSRVIVLEDDIETSPFFLQYMNDALDYYKDSSKVMHISGCRYPVKSFGEDDTFFLHVPLCWGWATWDRAWNMFDKNISIMKYFDKSMIRHFDFDGAYAYWKQLELNQSKKIDTWFVFWYAKLFLSGGLSLFPSISMVRNIGFDNSGVHCGSTSDYDTNISVRRITIKPIPLVESQQGFLKHVEYFSSLKKNIYSRIKLKFIVIINNFIKK